jgi:hypothetical protein
MFGEVKTAVQEVLDMFCTDVDLRRMITYRKFSGVTFSATTRQNVSTYINTVLSAIRLVHDLRSAQASAGEVQAGQPLYIIRGSEAPADMSKKDLILDDGNTLKVAIIQDLLGVCYLVTCEGNQ